MNELTQTARQLPDNLEDLSKFVLVGREKLNAVRAEIRAIQKVQLAAEVHEQKLQEAQEIAEAVLDAETKLGELTAAMEKAQGFASIRPTDGGNVKTKTEQLKELGITHAERYETLAKHPELVEQAKQEAREKGDIVTRQSVLHKIIATEYPNKQQEAAQELREAKRRVAEYEEPTDVISFADAIQNKTDVRLISEEFCKYFYEKGRGIGLIETEITNRGIDYLLKGATKQEIAELENHAARWLKSLLHIQRILNERSADEK